MPGCPFISHKTRGKRFARAVSFRSEGQHHEGLVVPKVGLESLGFHGFHVSVTLPATKSWNPGACLVSSQLAINSQ